MFENNCTSPLNNIFSKRKFLSFMDNKKQNFFCTVVKRYIDNPENKTNHQLISEIYSIISEKHKNEYFYKNTILNYLLCELHDYENTIALSEIPIGNAIADLVLLNGKANVYEIKTSLDTLSRLKNQIENYYKAFDNVSVITSKKYIDKVDEVVGCDCIGIFELTDDNQINTIREPKTNKDFLDKNVMFSVLRQKEQVQILNDCDIVVNNLTDFNRYQIVKEAFLSVDIDKLYNSYIKILKKRQKIKKETYLQMPDYIKSLVYFSNFNNVQIKKLNIFLEEKYKGDLCTIHT